LQLAHILGVRDARVSFEAPELMGIYNISDRLKVMPSLLHDILFLCSKNPSYFWTVRSCLSEAPRQIYRMSEQDPLKEDSNSNFTEIPVNRLSLPLIGNKMVED
jgi:hypothetical protein